MKFKLAPLDSFKKDFKKLPPNIKKKVERILKLLAKNLRHPSVRAKKIQGKKDIWEGRVNRFYRFTFTIRENNIILRRVGSHDKTLR